MDARFVTRMKDSLGPEADDFFSALETEAPTAIILHPAKKPGKETFQGAQVPWCPFGLYLDQRPLFTFDPLFHAGCYYVMEASSMFIYHAINHLADKNKTLRVLDLCGAPGGKSIVALTCLSPQSLLVSNEVNKSRFNVLQFNIDKWGTANVIRTCLDPERIPLTGQCDLVIVDAPCSGEGLFRKDQDARDEWSPAHVLHCTARQKRILAEAERLLAPGGHLIYSTCTYSDAENIDQVHWMNKTFDMRSIEMPLAHDWSIDAVKSDMAIGYQFYPHKVRGEGFFCAALQKPVSDQESAGASQQAFRKRASEKPVDMKRGLVKWIDPDILDDTGTSIATVNDEIYFLNSGTTFEQQLPDMRVWPGAAIGMMKGNDFIPSHALALSQSLHPDIPSVELDYKQAMKYLRKDTIEVEVKSSGWHVARYQGFALGWLKQTQAGLKNYLPTKYRVIKQDKSMHN